MDNFIVIFSDLMVWFSIPMTVGAGIWETHLQLTATSHILLRIGVMLMLLAWIRFWFSTGEYQRLRNRLAVRRDMLRRQSSPSQDETIFQMAPNLDDCGQGKKTENEIAQRKYVENH